MSNINITGYLEKGAQCKITLLKPRRRLKVQTTVNIDLTQLYNLECSHYSRGGAFSQGKPQQWNVKWREKGHIADGPWAEFTFIFGEIISPAPFPTPQIKKSINNGYPDEAIPAG